MVETETRLEHLSDPALACRDLRHGWEFLTDYTVVERREKKKRGEPVVIERAVKCFRCGCIRKDTFLLPQFERLGTTYEYPERYLTRGVKGGVTISEVRAEAYRRTTAKTRHLAPA